MEGGLERVRFRTVGTNSEWLKIYHGGGLHGKRQYMSHTQKKSLCCWIKKSDKCRAEGGVRACGSHKCWVLIRFLSLDHLYRWTLLEGKITEARTFSVTTFLLIRSLITTPLMFYLNPPFFSRWEVCVCVCMMNFVYMDGTHFSVQFNLKKKSSLQFLESSAAYIMHFNCREKTLALHVYMQRFSPIWMN